MLIGCDGPLSSVGKLLGVRNENLFAAQIRIRHSFDQNEAVMFFDPRWKELFGWIVPEGNDIFRIGLASSKKVSAKFKIFLKKLRIDINKIIDQQGGIIPYGVMNRSAFDNVLLLGDSAGQVKATTGGGIVMLLTAAKHAAFCIQKCFTINNYSRKIVKKYYEKPCLATIGRQLKIHYLIRLVFERFSNEDFENLFRIIKTSNIEHLISLYGDMDFPKSMIIKLMKNFLVLKFLFRFLRNNLILVIEILKFLK
ncbi:MAG: NAD(P)/FAD-dependent oxidoreductase [Promethearchaeota archaeon]